MIKFINNKKCKELYCDITCALTHNISVCDRCKKCDGNSGAEIRLNMIKKYAKIFGYELPWKEITNEGKL